MYTSTTAKSDHIDSFNNAQNRMLMNYERDEFEQAPAAVLYDAVGAVVNDESDIDIIFRLMDMEGEMLFLRAMKNLGCQENVFYYESGAVLTANDATLLEFAYNLGKHISNEFFTRFLRNSQLARELIGNIIRIGNDALKFPDDDLNTVFEFCVMENSSWKNQRHFKDNFGL
ncbi:Uncharacterised protein [Escherichia coli]|uniref:hypothetical protein n=1 Tax=Escherichia coli TaxID=562 RepID=UPI0015E581B9|nr:MULTISPECIES: hypothetical protein [Enterobacteriaceae]QLO06856.1 hypothetical protein HV141_25645 [Citrobacter freundii]VVY57961.1 Uncharacterised protein [Escherichia coli]VVZ63759.1 Uncharacterised protein [Escherichia coli]VWN03373.1 Uncharacterised protein [Escherichia coli]